MADKPGGRWQGPFSTSSSPLSRIWTRATYDPEFRKRLMDKPRKTLEDDLGLMLPEDMKVNVVENTEAEYTIVLPMPEEVDGQGDVDDETVGFAAICYVYHIPEHNFAVDLRLDGVGRPPRRRGFGSNPNPRKRQK